MHQIYSHSQFTRVRNGKLAAGNYMTRTKRVGSGIQGERGYQYLSGLKDLY